MIPFKETICNRRFRHKKRKAKKEYTMEDEGTESEEEE